MSAQLLSGKEIAGKIKESLIAEAAGLKEKHGRAPVLAAVQLGENPGSAVYVKSQKNNAEKLGLEYQLHQLADSTTQKELIDFIEKLNNDDKVDGIILQMPVPDGIDGRAAVQHISPDKDAEGMHPENLGKVVLASGALAPCTPQAVMELIKASGIDLYGKEAVVVGHSEIVGKPVSLLLLEKLATTTVCHIGTGERGNLPDHVKRAEVLVVAVGVPGLVKGDWIKQGAVVIDVGINRIDGKIVGDVEFEAASQRAAFITPVPGGVGPLTVTMLLRNVIQSFKNKNK
ncbi:MAG: bifunctional 5,10-methylenetetrahydrofolate dehydrogenase/5,10-methenyltetrahydrofolate cyclohydrolase [Candidatus Omnitrophica bacterium]|nr:bifunctional 5,10-methylenetetrahydrofolate dehydrogenase/5,10-methenyltetrahydrofolate cyclohydrolase [Candidatus Omnitrophota bacterium]